MPAAQQTDARRTFALLTVTKLVGNFALRLGYPFNTDIAAGLHTSLATVGRLQGIGELCGLAGVFTGRPLDRGRYRSCVVAGTAMLAVGGLVLGLASSRVAFAVGFALIALGLPVMTTATHTWIGATIPYERRGRAVGIYETSWAVALLIGAPVAGFMIDRFRWWSPFLMFGVFAAVLVPVLWRHVPNRGDGGSVSLQEARVPLRITRPMAAVVSCAVSLTMAGIVVFATFGAWLKDRHGFTTGGVAGLALALGVAELAGSGCTAVFSDRIGKRASIASGSAAMMIGLVLMLVSGRNTQVAVAGIVTLFGGFEFAFVSHFPVLTEVGGAARGRLLSTSGALVTAARAVGAVTGTALYQRAGMGSVVTVALVFAAVALTSALMLPRDGRSGRTRPAEGSSLPAGLWPGTDGASARAREIA